MSNFVKHDGKKGCSPSLVPIDVRRAFRELEVPASTMTAAYIWVEAYEFNDREASLLSALVTLARVDHKTPQDFLWEVAEVMDMGAKKYSRDNWMKCPYEERYRYLDAFYRHAWAFDRGETIDTESGKHHLAHAACCLSMLHGLIRIEKTRDMTRQEAVDKISKGLNTRTVDRVAGNLQPANSGGLT